MKNTKLLCRLILCYTGLIRAPNILRLPLEGVLSSAGIREPLLPYLPKRDIMSSSHVSQPCVKQLTQ